MSKVSSIQTTVSGLDELISTNGLDLTNMPYTELDLPYSSLIYAESPMKWNATDTYSFSADFDQHLNQHIMTYISIMEGLRVNITDVNEGVCLLSALFFAVTIQKKQIDLI